MAVVIERSVSARSAAILGAILCLPFLFAITTAITNFKPFASLISSGGHATTFGLAIFYIGLIGLPLAFLINLISMLSLEAKFSKWSLAGKIAIRPKPLNMLLAAVSLAVVLVFGEHLLIDAVACFYGRLAACD